MTVARLDDYISFQLDHGWPQRLATRLEAVRVFDDKLSPACRQTWWRVERKFAEWAAMQRLMRNPLWQRYSGRRASITRRGEHPDVVNPDFEAYMQWLQEAQVGSIEEAGS